jgi:hypothetical protein
MRCWVDWAGSTPPLPKTLFFERLAFYRIFRRLPHIIQIPLTKKTVNLLIYKIVFMVIRKTQ